MENLINKTQLEETLLKHWTYFIDHKRLMAMILKNVRDNQFPAVKTKEVKMKGTQIKLSRFEPKETGFTVWVEFSVPQDDKLVVGTSEFHLSNLGNAEHIQTLGNVFFS